MLVPDAACLCPFRSRACSAKASCCGERCGDRVGDPVPAPAPASLSPDGLVGSLPAREAMPPLLAAAPGRVSVPGAARAGRRGLRRWPGALLQQHSHTDTQPRRHTHTSTCYSHDKQAVGHGESDFQPHTSVVAPHQRDCPAPHPLPTHPHEACSVCRRTGGAPKAPHEAGAPTTQTRPHGRGPPPSPRPAATHPARGTPCAPPASLAGQYGGAGWPSGRRVTARSRRSATAPASDEGSGAGIRGRAGPWRSASGGGGARTGCGAGGGSGCGWRGHPRSGGDRRCRLCPWRSHHAGRRWWVTGGRRRAVSCGASLTTAATGPAWHGRRRRVGRPVRGCSVGGASACPVVPCRQ